MSYRDYEITRIRLVHLLAKAEFLRAQRVSAKLKRLPVVEPVGVFYIKIAN